MSRVKIMPNLAAKTNVGTCKCFSCGKKGVKILINVNGIAYYYCPWTDEDGERCNDQHRWGRKVSQEMQRDYLASRAANKNAPPKDAPNDRKSTSVQDEPEQPEPNGDSGDDCPIFG